MRTHTGEKPFPCWHCHKAFSQPNSLTIHLRTHTGEKPFPCTHCGSAFSDRANWKVHERRHTGEKPYWCTHCEFRSVSGSGMKCHLKMHEITSIPTHPSTHHPRMSQPLDRPSIPDLATTSHRVTRRITAEDTLCNTVTLPLYTTDAACQ